MNDRRLLTSLVGLLVPLTLPDCGSPSVDCHADQVCAPSADGGPDIAAADGGEVPAPPGCDPAVDPKDAPKCVVTDYGVFVDATSGQDTNPGSKESPVKTIGAALGKLAGKRRLYVCEGTYAEHVKLTSAVSLYGGFACGTWHYSGTKPKIAAAGAGFALEVNGLTIGVTVSDFELRSTAAVLPGDSSIAVFIVDAPSVTFRRIAVAAGRGTDAPDEGPPTTNLFSANIADLEGSGATGTIGGTAKVCACKLHGSSVGGKAGDGANGNGIAGSATPSAQPIAPDRDGAGGIGGAGSCNSGHSGGDGAPGAAGTGASQHGSISPEGWRPGSGTDGQPGNPGQGGGGGGARANGGGGGGCGGCGGNRGSGAKGGGSSIGVLALRSGVLFEDGTIVTVDAGNGGTGGKGEGGGGGGGGGNVGACGGGDGGNGAGGGGGGGGAGGVSAGIVHSEGSVRLNGTTTGQGKPGAGGAGGPPGGGGVNPANGFPAAPGGFEGGLGKAGVAVPTLNLTN